MSCGVTLAGSFETKKVEVVLVYNLHSVIGYLSITARSRWVFSLIAILTIYLITPRFVV